MIQRPHYQRILLKISGEALMGTLHYGVDSSACQKIASNIIEIRKLGVQVAIVVGGGNIFRGIQGCQNGFSRVSADHMGMLATLINGIALEQTFHLLNVPCHLMSAIGCSGIVAPFSCKEAIALLEQNSVLIFVGGTGNPYFTTDSAAALRALEIRAEILMKATKVDGIYNKDPVKYPDAKKIDRISYSDVLSKQLGVMDATAIALCRENRLPIRVIDMFNESSLRLAVFNEPVGTLVEEEKK